MGNGASKKKYDAVVLADATIHSADADGIIIPEALVPSPCAGTWEAKKQAVTLQDWTFAPTSTAAAAAASGSTRAEAVGLQQTQCLNPEKYQFTRGAGEAREVLATIVCTHRKLGGTTFTVYRTEAAYRGQKPCDDPTLTKMKEEGPNLYPYAEISIQGVSSATYCLQTPAGLKEVYKVQKMGMVQFRCVIEQSGGGAVAKARQANAIGSKGVVAVGTGCDLMAVCSLVILLINANQQAGH